MQCATCQSTMNLIPAGVSQKTGNPYNSFYACPNRCPKPTAGVKAVEKITQAKENEKEYWGGVRQEKATDIRANVALKGAIDLLVADKIELTEWTRWANDFFNYKPEEYPPFK